MEPELRRHRFHKVQTNSYKARLGRAVEVVQRTRLFADDGTLIPNDAAEYLAEQIDVRTDELSGYDFGGKIPPAVSSMTVPPSRWVPHIF